MQLKQEILRLEKISTVHNGYPYLKEAQLNVFNQEIIGIIGVNNSGKTALAGAICGFLPCSQGRIYFMENLVSISSITQAQNLGISYIQKNSALISDMSVKDNLLLTSMNHPFFLERNVIIESRIQSVLDIFDVKDIDLYAMVDSLSEYHRLIVEICRAILIGVKIIVLDSVISAVSPILFNRIDFLLQRLQTIGISIILIETKYRTIHTWCNRLFIMREGRTVGVFNRGVEEEKIASMMLGFPTSFQSISAKSPITLHPSNKELLIFENVQSKHGVEDYSFTAYEKEITGILCADKSSHQSLEYILKGLISYKGTIMFQNKTYEVHDINEAFNKGIVFMQDSPNYYSEKSFEDNILISAFKSTSIGPFLNHSELKYRSVLLWESFFREYNKLSKAELSAYIHEGKDWLFLKKMMLCRCLAADPRLVVLINPTQYNDFTIRNKFYKDIRSLLDFNTSGLILSTDLEEILALCDRAYLVQNGRVMRHYFLNNSERNSLTYDFSLYL